MRRWSHIVLALIGMICVETAFAQSPYRVEYFLDNDPGYGLAQVITNIHVGGNELTFDLSEAASGAHVLYVRAQDMDGKWSTTMSRPLFIDRFQDIVYVEYFFDNDPGYGLGRKLENPRTGQNTYLMDFTGIEHGAHVLYLRAQDTNGYWSTTLSRPLYVYQTSGKVVALEYFFDANDPGEGKATKVQLPSNLKEPFAFDVAVGSLSAGQHQLNVRAKGDDGKWSVVHSEPFRIIDGGATGIVSMERMLPIGMKTTTQACTLTAESDLKGDCQVDIVTVGGMRIASELWTKDQSQFTVPINVSRGTVLVVSINDTKNHLRVVRRLIVK